MAQSIQPLSAFKVLDTQDVDAARAAMVGIYGDMKLAPVGRNSSFSARVTAAPAGPLLITSHEWAESIDAYSPFLDGCFDFCTLIEGRGVVRIGRRAVDCSPERGVVMAPIHPMQANAIAGISLNVKVPSTVAAAHVRALTGREISEPLDFEADMRMQGEIASVWRLAHFVAAELERDPSLLGNPLVMERYADTLLTSFIASQPNNYSQWIRRESLPAEPRYVRLVEEYLEAHCDQPITARGLAEVAGVSVSALYAGFKRHRGSAPLKFLDEIRLRRVRDTLLKGIPGTTVKEIGLRLGFSSSSGLSRAYGRRFGETPSETLRRATRRQ